MQGQLGVEQHNGSHRDKSTVSSAKATAKFVKVSNLICGRCSQMNGCSG